MKQIFPVSAAVLLMSACAVPTPDNILLPRNSNAISAGFDQTPTVARSEEDEAATTRKLRQDGTNTYAQTCGGLIKSGALAPMDERFVKRVGSAADSERRKPSMLRPPAMTDVPPLQTSVICRVLVDVNADGIPLSPIAQCTDSAFEASAAATILTARFQPMPYPGLIMPMEFCRND